MARRWSNQNPEQLHDPAVSVEATRQGEELVVRIQLGTVAAGAEHRVEVSRPQPKAPNPYKIRRVGGLPVQSREPLVRWTLKKLTDKAPEY